MQLRLVLLTLVILQLLSTCQGKTKLETNKNSHKYVNDRPTTRKVKTSETDEKQEQNKRTAASPEKCFKELNLKNGTTTESPGSDIDVFPPCADNRVASVVLSVCGQKDQIDQGDNCKLRIPALKDTTYDIFTGSDISIKREDIICECNLDLANVAYKEKGKSEDDREQHGRTSVCNSYLMAISQNSDISYCKTRQLYIYLNDYKTRFMACFNIREPKNMKRESICINRAPSTKKPDDKDGKEPVDDTRSGSLVQNIAGGTSALVVFLLIVALIVFVRKTRTARENEAERRQIERIAATERQLSTCSTGTLMRLDALNMNEDGEHSPTTKGKELFASSPDGGAEWLKSRSIKFRGNRKLFVDRGSLSADFEKIPFFSSEDTARLPVEAQEKTRDGCPLPFKHTMIKLERKNSSNSNFINANLISCYNHEASYIAAQSPMVNTVADFLRMLWQQNCTVVVQLHPGDDCEAYLPTTDHTRSLAGFQLVEKSRIEQESENCIVKTISVTDMETHLRRQWQHFEFTGEWNKRHDSPVDMDGFVRFIEAVQDAENNNTAPSVVHCSDGAHFTGLLIGAAICMRMVRASGSCDVMRVVHQLRQDRPRCLPSVDQYVYLHQLLHAYASKLRDKLPDAMSE